MWVFVSRRRMVRRPRVETRKNAGEVEQVLLLNQTKGTVQMKPVRGKSKNTSARK